MDPATSTLSLVRNTKLADLADLHPLKLDQLHKGLVGLPDTVYLQYGCEPLYGHVVKALDVLTTMFETFGEKDFPENAKEIARRKIRTFSWYVPSTREEGVRKFFATWDQDMTSWVVSCETAASTKKMVPEFEQCVDLAKKWNSELDGEG